jgi:hypothetical protein
VKLQVVICAGESFLFFSFLIYFFIFIEMTPSQIEDTPMLFAEDTTVIEFWVTLKQDKDYEINDLTLEIRCIETKREVCITNKIGYTKVGLGGKTYSYHRLVAEMFVYNPDPLTRTNVDHIDRNKHNNTIENLQWVSPSGNGLNRSFFRNYVGIFVKSLPIDARRLTHYKGNELKHQYFISNNSVYIKTETEYRQLNVINKKEVCLQFKNDNRSHHIRLHKLLNTK